MAKVIGEKKTLWQQICEDYDAEQLSHPNDIRTDDASISRPTQVSQYSGSKHSPAKVFVDNDPVKNFDPLVCHPVLAGYWDECWDKSLASSQKHTPTTDMLTPPQLKDCPITRFMEERVFPVLLPALEAMLRDAQKKGCFHKKRTTFNPCDFLTEWLYNHNPQRQGQSPVDFLDIPFVKDWLSEHPRPPIPLSLLLSEEQAALMIQASWRGHKVRLHPEVQELRQWQRELREENRAVHKFMAQQESRVGSAVRNLPECSEAGSSGVSIEVVSPTPQNTVVHTPTVQLSAGSRNSPTPSRNGVEETTRPPLPTGALVMPEHGGQSLAALSPSISGNSGSKRNLNH